MGGGGGGGGGAIQVLDGEEREGSFPFSYAHRNWDSSHSSKFGIFVGVL